LILHSASSGLSGAPDRVSESRTAFETPDNPEIAPERLEPSRALAGGALIGGGRQAPTLMARLDQNEARQ
jgi:hypothetical protein